ncbi:MAG: DUF2892 domain-containing protein [Gemmatimonadota bacterium]|nr:DUF2892 domain-containing protein [Gemmatimonadota bacterium]
MFQANCSGWDRGLRLVFGGALLYIGWAILFGLPGGVLMTLGGGVVLTGFLGRCPVYTILGLGTRNPPPPPEGRPGR